MENHSLEVQSRTITGKHVKRLRKDGIIPGVLYGNGKASQSIALDRHAFTKLYNELGSTTLLSLTIDGSQAGKVLVHDIQSNPLRRTIVHVDLFEVNLKEKLRTQVPLVFEGTSDAIELLGGSLLTIKDEVEVECLPEKLVQELTIDISVLKTFDDAIKVSDLNVPEGVTILDDGDDVIASVAQPRSEEEMNELNTEVADTTDTVESETGTEPAEPGTETTSK